jgi:N-acetylglucosaminyldiphosphoundecaprenol N-acetyl-beta-D-mannosaminyltransferase
MTSMAVAGADDLNRAHERSGLPSIRLRGVRVHAVTESEAVGHIMGSLERGVGGWVITPNLDHLRRAELDREFAGFVDRADLVVADGMPLIWASRLQGTPLPERVAGSTLVETLAATAASSGRSLFLLGGDPGAAEGAARVLQGRHPSLRIVGTLCPEFGFEGDSDAFSRVEEAVVSASPDIVYVALGSPKQERVIARLRGRLPGTWWLGVGISLSFLAGQVRRAPRWVQRLGLEWVHRLAQEPDRLLQRYLVHGVPFGIRLLASAMICRWDRREKTMNTGGD